MNVRIIDLLSLESRGMEVPTKIRVFDHTFIYTGDKRPLKMYKMENQDNYLLSDFVYTLNTEVEILEEGEIEKNKIPERISAWYEFNATYDKELTKIMLDELKDKYNEIIDYLNKEKNNKF